MRKQLLFLLLLVVNQLGAENLRSYSFYGFIRNDFYYNSRQSEESLDGIFHFYPKPVIAGNGVSDINAVPHAEMLSIATRVGVDLNGGTLGKTQISAKIESDFAGVGTNYFLMRIRQAYVRFDWAKYNLLIGQTWHPLWGSVAPTMVSFNSGSPFQPFNRSPQIRLNYTLFDNFTLSAASSWQMQTSSNGPLGFTPAYMKNSLTPNLFVGVQYLHDDILIGGGLDYKRIMPDPSYTLTSSSAVAYIQYNPGLLSIKAKSVLGNNLSDHIMLGGYGKLYNPSTNTFGYTNLTGSSSWINIVYGKQWQVGIFGGLHKNLGSQMPMLHRDNNGNFTIYGRGFYHEQQELLDRLVRIAPFVMHSMKDLTIGVEYNYTLASYGKIQSDGSVINPYQIGNHRIVATVIYTF